MLTIPEFAQPVLGSFAPVFYHPTYQRLPGVMAMAGLAAPLPA